MLTAIDLLTIIAGRSAIDLYPTNPDAIPVMTVHTAKGLEWPTVFVAGLEDGLFPHRAALHSQAEIDEESRCFYVAITRAASRVYLTGSAQRTQFGMTWENKPSRYMDIARETFALL